MFWRENPDTQNRMDLSAITFGDVKEVFDFSNRIYYA
jgi:hypothetical protein